MSTTYRPDNHWPEFSPQQAARIRRELSAIKQGLEDGKPSDRYVVLHAEPAKLYAGLIAYADGTDWNPGSGEGIYRYSVADGWVPHGDAALRADLAASSGASLMGFLPAGTGGVASTTEAALRMYPHASQYATNADYMAAVAARATGQLFSGSGAKIHRFPDRVLVGEASHKWGATASGVPDSGTSWLSNDANGPAFLGVHAHLLVTTEENLSSGARYAIVGAAKTSELTGPGGIGVAGAIVNAKAGSPGWAFYGDVQAQIGDNFTYGVEFACKNASGVNAVSNPYDFTAKGVIGIWLAAGGDTAYGPAPTNPSNTAIVIGNNDQTWNTGISFLAGGLTGTDGTAASATYATALQLARNHEITWVEPTNRAYGAKVRSRVTATAGRVMVDMLDNQIVLRGANESPMFSANYAAGAVNYLSVAASLTGSAPQLVAAGTDANIDLWLKGKGTGVVRFGHNVTGAITPANFSAAKALAIKDGSGTTYYVPAATATW